MRTPIIAGNWKMNKTASEARAFFSEFIKLTKDVKDVETIIAPPFTALSAAADAVKDTKIKTALKFDIVPIVCIGENLKEREANNTMKVIEAQLQGGLAGFSDNDMERIILAYEPVWAIGTGKTATPAQAQEVHKFIRDYIRKTAGNKIADGIRILYGGSVTPENIKGLMAEEDIDGALVGGASLKPDSFAGI